MPVYQISYDLRKQRNYDALYERIKRYHWCHALESSWVITTNQSAAQVRDFLMEVIDRDDGLLVTHLHSDASWVGLSQDVTNWLKQALERQAA